MHKCKLIPRNECSFKHQTIFACINTTLFGYFCKKLAKYNGRYKKQTVYYLRLFRHFQNHPKRLLRCDVELLKRKLYFPMAATQRLYEMVRFSCCFRGTYDYSNDPRLPPKLRSATVMLPI